MRNIFDQYTQHENRLTHAVVSVLAEDKKLCQKFIKWILPNSKIPSTIAVLEQQLVGEPPVSEEMAEKRGLPDAWLHDNEAWSLLIESKVNSPLKKEQLVRHFNTATRRGFSNITVVAICKKVPATKYPRYVVIKTWPECFEWLKKHESVSEWAGKAARYIEICESNWIAEGHLKEGTLTKFTGIPFTEKTPYNYREAKLYLKLAIEELKKRKVLAKSLGVALDAPGRSSITGRDAVTVWDYIPLKQSLNAGAHTHYPHFTLYINRDYVGAIVTVPNSIKTSFRNNIKALEIDGFFELLGLINKDMKKIGRKAKQAVPILTLMQRHYASQRSTPVLDAKLEFDIRTATRQGKNSGVKEQQEWVEAAYHTFVGKKSNMQLSIGMIFPYTEPSVTSNVDILDRVIDAWCACKPLVTCLLTGKIK